MVADQAFSGSMFFLVCDHGLGSLRLNYDIFRQGLESLPVRLDYGNGDIAGFPGLDISYDAGFANMDSADDFAFGAVFEFARWLRFHLCRSIALWS